VGNGSYSGTSTYCCSGYMDSSGYCQTQPTSTSTGGTTGGTCSHTGSSCSTDSQCCGGKCINFVECCYEQGEYVGTSVTFCCSGQADSSGYCTAGSATTGTTGTSGTTGASCTQTYHQYCDTSSGSQYCCQSGMTCTYDSSYQAYLCEGGSSFCGGNQAYCMSNSDCCSGNSCWFGSGSIGSCGPS
jgi:hypothetical protein